MSATKFSKIESGKEIPHEYTFLLLLERLGLDSNRYLYLLQNNDLEFCELKSKTI